MGNTAFDEWYDGLVGFHINSERILEEINNSIIITNHQVTVDPTVFRKWMEVCWNNALEAAQQPESVCWNDTVYEAIEN